MFEALIALVTATLLLLGTPGPVTLALAVTGATFGVKSGFRFLAGLLTGLSIAIICAMVGLAALFSTFPQLRIAFQLIGGLYICYLAWKIATADVLGDKALGQAPGFKDGFILNLFNPKAYAAFLSLFSQFLIPLEGPSESSLLISYAVTGITCFLMVSLINVSWLIFGGFLRPVFSKPGQARVIRVIFAILMITAVIYAAF